MDYKDEYIELFKKYIKRDGSEKILEYLEKSDFFTAPASTNFHSAYEGGLCQHCVKVFHRFLSIAKNEYGENFENFISLETIAICALLHDVCKVNFYKIDYRNVKENNVWVKKPYFAVDDKLPYGHGEKSVYIINGFMRLTREEAMIIDWHMGGFDQRVRGGSYALSDVFYLYPNALLFHLADVAATYLDETSEKYKDLHKPSEN